MTFKKADRELVYNKYGGKCAYCGESIILKNMQIDHIIPESRFMVMVMTKFRIPDFLKHLTTNDLNHMDNLNPACRVCNKWKSDHDLEYFRNELSEQIKRLNDYSSNFRIAKKYNLITETPKPIIFYFETINLS